MCQQCIIGLKGAKKKIPQVAGKRGGFKKGLKSMLNIVDPLV